MFTNRKLAAELLAKVPTLRELKGSDKVVVLGIPRGGVVTATHLARALGLSLDLIVTRKITASGNPEYAIGAVGESGPAVWNEDVSALFSPVDKQQMEERARLEAARRNIVFRQGKPPLLMGKTVLLVDDGLATGMTMRAAIYEVRHAGAKKVIVAAPVAPTDTVRELQKEADQVVVLEAPAHFSSVGQFYQEFPQVSDEEVVALVGKTREKKYPRAR